jgi:hypothetical protein
MYKLILTAFLFISINAFSQNNYEQPLDSIRPTYQYVDSITYQNYLSGNWDKLIKTGKIAIAHGVDYKNLRKRMGYAFFAKADYYSSKQQYQVAQMFDKFDTDIKSMLYYCESYKGNESGALYYLSRLPVESQKTMAIESFHPLDAIDFEYNYKNCMITTRSNPSYFRLGINSRLTYRLSLYQAISNYSQSEKNSNSTSTTYSSTSKNQFEYYVSLNWQLSSNTTLTTAYHYLNAFVTDTTTIIDASLPTTNPKYKTISKTKTIIPGNMFIAKLSSRFNRLDLSLYGSTYNMDNTTTSQIGLQVGLSCPGKVNLYLKSSVYGMFESQNNHLVFSQTAGLTLLKKTWLEGNLTLGNLKNYAENNGLYMYNPNDDTTFRTGITFLWYAGKKITFFGNYSYDTKLITTSNINYNQHSFSTGVIWKI